MIGAFFGGTMQKLLFYSLVLMTAWATLAYARPAPQAEAMKERMARQGLLHNRQRVAELKSELMRFRVEYSKLSQNDLLTELTSSSRKQKLERLQARMQKIEGEIGAIDSTYKALSAKKPKQKKSPR